ncbi:MAG: hypothetical protein KDB21_19885 [Acidimicrobiales bacterium]|nr:hypothetical protein [Acidimicrobiales bacterium]
MRGTIKWTAALLFVGALGVGWSAMTADGNDAPAPAAQQREPTDHSQAPTEIPEQRPVAATGPSETDPVLDDDPRFHQDEAGARAAAVAYLELTEEAVSLTPAEAAAVQRSIATAEFAEEFGADTEQKMVELTQTVPGGVILRVAPIEVRSVADGDDWLVSVWYAQAITMVGDAVVDDWRTASYRMRWEAGTWKIAAFSSQRGPTPGRGTQPASTSAVDFELLLDGYSDEGLG